MTDQRKLVQINVDDVWVDPSVRLRDPIEPEDVEPTVRSLKRVKQIEPIVVAEQQETKCAECQRLGNAACIHDKARRHYRLYCGERRLVASRVMGEKTIEAVVDNSLLTEPDRAEDVPYHENYFREGHSLWEVYREVIRRKTLRPDEPVSVLSDRTDLSVAMIEDCVRIHRDLAPDLVQKLRHDACANTFRHLATAARIDGLSVEDRHKAQRAWWAAEGWRKPGKAARVAGKGGGKGPRRPSAREVERIALRIEADQVVSAGGESVALGAKAARIVATLLRQVAGHQARGNGAGADAGTGAGANGHGQGGMDAVGASGLSSGVQ